MKEYKVIYKRTIVESYTEVVSGNSENQVKGFLEFASSEYFKQLKPTFIEEKDLEIIHIEEII